MATSPQDSNIDYPRETQPYGYTSSPEGTAQNQQVKPNPFGRFSPLRAGTFEVKDREGRKLSPDVLKRLTDPKGYIPKVGGELRPKKESAVTVQEDAEKVRLAEENSRLKARFPLLLELSQLELRWEQLQQETIKEGDTSISKEISGAFDTLQWLKTSPDEDTSNESIQSTLSSLRELLVAYERLSKKENTPPETIDDQKLFNDLQELQSTFDSLKDQLGTDASLPHFHVDVLTRQLEELFELQKERAGGSTSVDDVITRKLGAIQENINTFKKNAATFLEEKNSQQEHNEKPQDPTLVFDVWRGWPESITVTKNGDWFLQGKKLEPGVSWTRIKTNFDQEMNVYSSFLKTGTPETIAKKIELGSTMIIAKNNILAALLDRNTDLAFELLETFRNEIIATQEAWKKYTTEKEKEERLAEEKASAQRTVESSFEISEKLYAECIALKNSLFSGIKSEGERQVLTSKIVLLEKQREEIKKAKEKSEDISALVEIYEEDVHNLKTIIAGLDQHIKDFYMTNGSGGSQAIRTNPQKVKTVLRAGRTPQSISEYQTEEEGRRQRVEKTEDIKKIQSQDELFRLHRDNFYKNKKRYKEIYLHKAWEKEDPNKDAVSRVFAEYLGEIEGKIRQEESSIQDIEEELGRVDTDATDIYILQTKLNDAKTKIEDLQREFYDFSGVREIDTRDLSNKASALDNYRQTYSPANDSSVDDLGKDRKTLNFADKIAYDTARRSRQLPGEKNMSDREFEEKRTEASPLSNKTTPSHYKGMVTPGAGDLSAPHATPFEEEPKEHISAEEAPQDHPEVRRSSEETVKKQKAVDTLFTTRIKNMTRWEQIATAVYAAAAVGLGAGGVLVGNKLLHQQTSNEKPKTLGEAVSWRDFFNQQELNLIAVLLNTKEYDFYSFIQKASPETTIIRGNAATLTKVSKMIPYELLNYEGAVYGISNEERKDLCGIVNLLGRIIIKSDQYHSYSSSSSIYMHDKNETLEELFEKAKKAATGADSVEKK